MATKQITSWLFLGVILLSNVVIAGCTHSTTQRTSNLLSYLYPGETQPLEAPSGTISKLSSPIRIGMAFVPEGRTVTTNGKIEPLTEKLKSELMQELRAQLRQYPFIGGIEEIPSTYLKVGGSFTNLDQIRTMTGVDVIGLLSYDQVQFTDRGLLALLYWTGIGWYFVPGEKNDTNTMMDMALYHIPSRKPLIRATGNSRIYRYSTPMNQSQNLREDSENGFREALQKMSAKLREELGLLKERMAGGSTDSATASPGGGKLER